MKKEDFLMRKICKSIMICTFLCTFSFVSYAADLNELQSQKNEIQTQIDESNSQLNDVNDELTDNLKQIQKLDESIQSSEENIEKLNEEITKKENEIQQIESELEKVTEKYNTQKALLDERLVEMYENDNVKYLDVILKSKSFSDFVSNYYIISELTEYDMDLLEIVDYQRKEIDQNIL